MVNTDDYEDDEVEDIDCGTEIIYWAAYASDNYRVTADAADAGTAAEPIWVVAQCWQRGDEFAYEPLSDYLTLEQALEYMAAEDSELAALIAQAESTDDFQARERIIDEIGPLIREQIKAALPPTE